MRPGRLSGRITRRKVSNQLAPRLRAASSSAGLIRSIEDRRAATIYEGLRSRFAGLQPLTRPIDVVAAVSHEVDMDARDKILRPLAHVAGERSVRPLAQALLMLCLWPGLDAIFRRRFVLFRDPGYLATEIADHFSLALQRLDLRRVACLTATLVRNTERGILDARARDMIMVATDGVDEVASSSTGGVVRMSGCSSALPRWSRVCGPTTATTTMR